MSKQLNDKIKNKSAKIAIIGLGYVGLELAITIAKSQFLVFGFDKNKDKINLIKKNKSPINTISSKKINLLNKRYIYNLDNIKQIYYCDVIIIALPTPLTKNDKPDVSYLKNCYKDISPHFRHGQMIVLESTVYPGATMEIFGKEIAKKFNIGKNFHICFSPERISPGKKLSYEYKDIPKIISGKTKDCVNSLSLFYGKIFKTIHKCKTIEIAEFTKLYENAFRAVNIGFANQMKIVSSKMGINISEVINAAKTKPFGFTPFSPGPGVGGHCIPIDPLFISYVAKKFNVKSDFIELARKVNLETTEWVINKIKKNIKKNSKILILGAAYKKNIDDWRESPTVKIISKLKKFYTVTYYDPYISEIFINSKPFLSVKNLSYANLKNYSGIVIATDHDYFNYNKILKYSKIIFDTRNSFSGKFNKKIINC
jgi:UDP-N-acetyl-D-glucosamine dehydrogenase